MGLLPHQIESIYCLANTNHGETYYVTLKEEFRDNRHWKRFVFHPTCFRPLSEIGKQDQYCSQEAGFGTEHLHEGRCKYHRGKGGWASSKEHGARYSGHTKRKMKELYTQFSDDKDLLNLTPELVLMRSVLVNSLEKYQTSDYKNPRELLNVLNSIASLIDRIENINSRHVLTVSTARLVMIRAMDVAKRFIPPEDLANFVYAWQTEVKLESYLLEGKE